MKLGRLHRYSCRPQLEPGGRRSKGGGGDLSRSPLDALYPPSSDGHFLVSNARYFAGRYLSDSSSLDTSNSFTLTGFSGQRRLPNCKSSLFDDGGDGQATPSNRMNSQAARLPPTTVIHLLATTLTTFHPLFTLRLFSRRGDTTDDSRSITHTSDTGV